MWHRRRTDDGDDEQEQESVLPSGAFVRAAVGRVPGGGAQRGRREREGGAGAHQFSLQMECVTGMGKTESEGQEATSG